MKAFALGDDNAGTAKQPFHAAHQVTVTDEPQFSLFAEAKADSVLNHGFNKGFSCWAVGEVLLNGHRLERFPPIRFAPGDELELRMPGAGGFGPPGEREPELVARDVELGYVSATASARAYGRHVPRGQGEDDQAYGQNRDT